MPDFSWQGDRFEPSMQHQALQHFLPLQDINIEVSWPQCVQILRGVPVTAFLLTFYDYIISGVILCYFIFGQQHEYIICKPADIPMANLQLPPSLCGPYNGENARYTAILWLFHCRCVHLASNLLSRFLVCIPGWFGACAFLLDLFPRSFFTGAFLLDLFPRGPCAVESHPLGRAAGGSPLRIFWLVPKGNFFNVSVFGQGACSVFGWLIHCSVWR